MPEEEDILTEDEVLIQFVQDLERSFKTLEESFKELEGKVDSIDLNREMVQVHEIVKEAEDNVNALVAESSKRLAAQHIEKISAVQNQLEQSLQDGAIKSSELEAKIVEARKDLASQLKTSLKSINDLSDSASQMLKDFIKETKSEQADLKKLIEKLRKELTDDLMKKFTALASGQGGGNMNRKVAFNTTDYLTKYTDINYKAGTNVTFTIANNEATRMVDVTIAASGGGGGTVRVITSISGDTTAGSTAGTDYVYLCTGTLTLTLPTAVANTNLYTVKNVGTGVVTVATTSAQTIDGSLTIVMPVQFTSVDLISDTANWNVT